MAVGKNLGNLRFSLWGYLFVKLLVCQVAVVSVCVFLVAGRIFLVLVKMGLGKIFYVCL